MKHDRPERPGSRLTDYTDDERALFATLPVSSAIDVSRENATVAALRREGFFRPQRSRTTTWVQVAIAASLIVAAWVGGVQRGAAQARSTSIEGLLARADLTHDDRVLLMQRAGSAYVESAHAFASSVATTDSTAIEVSSQVLIGAAQAVARTNLDGGMGPRLAALISESRQSRPRITQAIWY